jgi:hypothetical protein
MKRTFDDSNSSTPEFSRPNGAKANYWSSHATLKELLSFEQQNKKSEKGVNCFPSGANFQI